MVTYALSSLLLLFPVVACAQEIRASISGTVNDPSGAAIAAARVVAVNTATNLRAASTTVADGRYILPQLDPGPYELSVEAAGFLKYNRKGITLNVGDKANVDVQLEIGSLAESVTVTAELTGIEANHSVMGQLIDDRQIAELPLNGRSFLMLLQLSAGVTFTAKVGSVGWAGTRQWETGPGAGQFTVHGSRPGTNAFLLDGAPLGVEGGPSYIPIPDAIEEFKVMAPTSDASQGLSGGGVVNVRMKSGTNEVHGVASEFVRNTIFDAVSTQTNRAAAQNPQLKQYQHQWNNFSGMISGPIRKNKFFGIANYDGFRQREPFPLTQTVPTLPQRENDFSQTFNAAGQMMVIYDPLTTLQEGTRFVRTPFAGNRLPQTRLVPVARNMLKYVPPPNTVTNALTNLNNFVASPNVSEFGYDSYYGKLEYLWNAKHRSFASGTQSWGHGYRSTNGIPRGNPAFNGIDPRKRDHAGATLDHTYAVGPRLVLNGRLAFDRWVETLGVDSLLAFDGSQLGFKGRIGSDPVTRFPRITFTDYLTLANTNPSLSPNDSYSAVVDVSATASAHFLKFGTRLGQARYSRYAAGQVYGLFAFTKAFTQRDPQRGDTTSGNAMAAFLLGYPNSGGTDLNPYSTYQNKFMGLYIQDDWKVSSRLTLNIGLRWDAQTAPTERFNRIIRGFDPNVTYQLGPAQARGGFLFADEGHRQPWTTNWRDLQPRFGATYRAGRRLVWRAGYGLSFLPLNGTGGAGGVQQSGYARRTPLVPTIGGGVNAFIPAMPGTGTLETPYPDGILPSLGSSLGPKTLVGQAITYLDVDYVVPRVHQFHFGLDYELPWKTTMEVSYVGSRTRRFAVARQLDAIPLEERLKGVADPNYLNASVPNPFAGAPELAGTGLAAGTVTRAQSLRPFPQFSGVTANGLSLGSSSYNALEVKVNKRLSGGLLFTAAYTFAKTLEMLSYLEDQYTSLERVLSDVDRPQHFSAHVLYELPLGRGRHLGKNWGRVLDAIAGNWQLNVILEDMAGTPTVMPDATPVRDPRLPEGQRSYKRWFNTCTQLTNGTRANCASPDEPVTWVQLKPNELRTFSSRFPNLRDPQRAQINLSLFKSFPIRERLRLELRAEAFNASNTPIYSGPATNFASANFGEVVLDQWNFARQMQFAMRLKF